jgi:hypothetical protein
MKEQITQYDLLEEMLCGLRRELALKDGQLALQAKEYERRLQDLNHENERILIVLERSIPREVFDRTVEGMNAKTQLNTDYINSAKGKGTGANAVIGYIFGVAGFLAALVAVFYYLSKK